MFNPINTGLFRGSVILGGSESPLCYFQTTNDMDIKSFTIISYNYRPLQNIQNGGKKIENGSHK